MSGIFQPTFRMFSGLFEYAGVLLLVATHSMSRPKQTRHYLYRPVCFHISNNKNEDFQDFNPKSLLE